MLGYFFPPSKAAGTFRTLRFVRDLPEYGWRPRVLTVQPRSYPAGDLDAKLLSKVPNEITVHRTAAPPLHRWFKHLLLSMRNLLVGRRQPPDATTQSTPGTVASSPPIDLVVTAPPTRSGSRHGFSLTDWIYTLLRSPDIDAGWRWPATWRGLWLILRHRPALIYVTGGPWTSFLIARDLSRLTRVPLVIDFRDPWTHNPAARARGGFLEAMAKRQEASVVHQAARIVANTEVLKETLVRAHGPVVDSKCIVIHNSFDAGDYCAPAPPQPELLTLSYVGSLYDAHSPEPFLRALRELLVQHPDLRGRFQVRLVGSGAPRTSQMVLGLGLDDVVEVGAPVAHADAIKLQRSSHILLLFLTVASDASTFIPSKLFEYIAAQRPIFAITRGGALQRILQQRQLTPWVYSPEDLDGIAEGLRSVIDQYETGTLPQLSMEIVESFSGRAAARSLAAIFDSASSRKKFTDRHQDATADTEIATAASEAR